MSISNYSSQGSKPDQNLNINNLKVNGNFEAENLTLENLTINNNLLVKNNSEFDGVSTFNEITSFRNQMNVSNTNLFLQSSGFAMNQGTFVTQGNVDWVNTDGEIFSSGSSQIGTVGNILFKSGQFSWASGANKGDTPLIITGMEGNKHEGYILKIKFVSLSTNSNNSLVMFFNNDQTNIYGTGTNKQNDGSTVSLQNQPYIEFMPFKRSQNSIGGGTFDIWTSKVNPLVHVSVTGSFSQQVENASSAGNITTVGGIYRDTTTTEITSMTIDVNNTNHAGMTILYKIYRYS